MSLFRKPKKIQRRVFSSTLDDEDLTANGSKDRGDHLMDVDGDMIAPPPPTISVNKKKDKSKEGKQKSSSSKSLTESGSDGKLAKTKALLSFADDEDDAEVFQVRKSSHSKKMMRMLDKERRKKKRSGREDAVDEQHENGRNSSNIGNTNNLGSKDSRSNVASGSKYNRQTTSSSTTTTSGSVSSEYSKSKKSDSIQTEIRTDDFVLVVKKSDPEVILNGRAAFCAGRDDMSDEETEEQAHSDTDNDGRHRFSKPEHLKQMLESGSIPDAAMIHAARKRRQKAREQGDFIPVEEPKDVPKKGSRLAREDVEGDNSDDEERVDMNAISGVKEREERREQFYSVEHDSSDSDLETNDWEAQQIRKGVTGAQLVTAQQESVLSRFIIKSTTNALEYGKTPQSTFTLLEQAYAKNALDKPKQRLSTTKPKKDKAKMQTLRSPPEIKHAISSRLTKLKELHTQHTADIVKITNELKVLQLEQIDCTQNAPTAAAKYRFYQEVKCYVVDLIDCLNEKTAAINDLEKLTIQTMSKHQIYLIERRRQDVRDQAKEMAEALKPSSSRRAADNEEQVRRAAEREGRRTRRRCEREKNDLLATHLDGMSSDEETSDHYIEQYKTAIEQLDKEADEIFNDVNDEFCKVEMILMKFYAWRKTDMESYMDAFVSLCLPKVLGPLIRMEILTWSPLNEDYIDIEKMNWYAACMLYAWSENETEESLKLDPDVNLVPTVIEKIILPKLTEIVHLCWDPLSTTQTLRLIGCISRLGRDFPLKETSKSMQHLFNTILEKMNAALENDVFIPIFPKQVQEAKTSFFQRQFCSGLKLFRNFLSWQGIVADKALRDLAIASLLNRYLLMAMRVCTANDALSKAYVVVNTLPTAWLQPESETLQNMHLFIMFIKSTLGTCDTKNPLQMQSLEKATQILQRLHSY